MCHLPPVTPPEPVMMLSSPHPVCKSQGAISCPWGAPAFLACEPHLPAQRSAPPPSLFALIASWPRGVGGGAAPRPPSLVLGFGSRWRLGVCAPPVSVAVQWGWPHASHFPDQGTEAWRGQVPLSTREAGLALPDQDAGSGPSLAALTHPLGLVSGHAGLLVAGWERKGQGCRKNAGLPWGGPQGVAILGEARISEAFACAHMDAAKQPQGMSQW